MDAYAVVGFLRRLARQVVPRPRGAIRNTRQEQAENRPQNHGTGAAAPTTLAAVLCGRDGPRLSLVPWLVVGLFGTADMALAIDEPIGVYEGVAVQGQCVAFARAFASQVYGSVIPPLGADGGARLIWEDPSKHPSNTSQVANAPDVLPVKHDIMVFNQAVGSYGHVAIVDEVRSRSEVVIVDSNWHGNEQGCRHDVNINSGAVYGWFHPDRSPYGGAHSPHIANWQIDRRLAKDGTIRIWIQVDDDDGAADVHHIALIMHDDTAGTRYQVAEEWDRNDLVFELDASDTNRWATGHYHTEVEAEDQQRHPLQDERYQEYFVIDRSAPHIALLHPSTQQINSGVLRIDYEVDDTPDGRAGVDKWRPFARTPDGLIWWLTDNWITGRTSMTIEKNIDAHELPDCNWALGAEIYDRLGNQFKDTVPGRDVLVDTTDPGLVQLRAEPQYANTATVLHFEVTDLNGISELLVGVVDPWRNNTDRLIDEALVRDRDSGTFSLRLEPGYDARYPLILRARDRAGNEVVFKPGDAWFVQDMTAPRLRSASLSQDAVDVGQSVDLTYEIEEENWDRGSLLVLQVGASVSRIDLPSESDTVNIQTSGLKPGIYDFAIQAVDRAANDSGILPCGRQLTVRALPPVLTSIEPTEALQGSNVTVTIAGQDLHDGATVSLGAGIAIGQITVAGGTSISAEATVADDATPGKRDLIVTNPFGRPATLAQAFTVLQRPAVGAVTLDPGPGTYAHPVGVRVNCSTEGAQVRYELDGSEPDANSPVLGPDGVLRIESTATVVAQGTKAGFLPGPPTQGVYTITGKVAAPSLVPRSGSDRPVVSDQPVQFETGCATPEATVHYRLDGGAPTTNDPQVPEDGRLLVDASAQLRARGFRDGWEASDVSAADCELRVAQPSLSPSPGVHKRQVVAQARTASPGVALHCTVDGSEPSPASSLFPSEGLALTESAELRVRGYREGWTPSDVTVGAYTVVPGSPDPARSTVTLSRGSIAADGYEAATAEVALFYDDGRPVVGSAVADWTVEARSDQALVAALSVDPLTQNTDERGVGRLLLKANAPGDYDVTVRAEGVDLAPVRLVALPAFRCSIPAGMSFIGWPVSSDRGLRDILGATGWRGAWYDPSAEAWVFVKPEDAAQLQPAQGAGMVLQMESPKQVTIPGELTRQEPFTMALRRGWNLVGNPYSDALAWDPSAVKVYLQGAAVGPLANEAVWTSVAPYAWAWDAPKGRYCLVTPDALAGLVQWRGDATREVPPMGAFWVKCLRDGVELLLPSTPSKARGRRFTSSAPNRWAVTVQVATATGSTAGLVVGVSGELGQRLTIAAPPTVSGRAAPVGAVLVGEGPLVGDIRPHLSDGIDWAIDVTTQEVGAEVTLQWPGLLRELPRGVVLILTDQTTGQRVLMNTRASFTYNGGRALERRRFTLTARCGHVGRATITNLHVMSHRDRSTAVSVTVSAPAELLLAVKGLGGRVLRRLRATADAAGMIAVNWDGCDADGRRVPAGIYWVEVAAATSDGAVSKATRTVLLR